MGHEAVRRRLSGRKRKKKSRMPDTLRSDRFTRGFFGTAALLSPPGIPPRTSIADRRRPSQKEWPRIPPRRPAFAKSRLPMRAGQEDYGG